LLPARRWLREWHGVLMEVGHRRRRRGPSEAGRGTLAADGNCAGGTRPELTGGSVQLAATRSRGREPWYGGLAWSGGNR